MSIRKALIDADGKVANIILLDDAIHQWAGLLAVAIPDGAMVQAGDAYDASSGVFTPAPSGPQPVPQQITALKARAALAQSGHLAQVAAAVAALPTTDLARIYWDLGEDLHRDSPALNAMGAAMGLDLDALFIAASQLDSSKI